jgi:transcriptional regulator
MYCPNHFQENDHDSIIALISAYPLATIVRNTESGLVADHIPLFYEKGKLIGHVAKANPLWQTAPDLEILVIFQGSDAYISPNWYATKRSSHKVVPTWNYTSVHVYGSITAINDAQRNLEIVQKLTSIHEKNLPQPWSVHDAPADYLEKMLSAIVGIEISISNIEAKWKVSQNQPPENQRSLVEHLKNSDHAAANCMAEEVSKKFKP